MATILRRISPLLVLFADAHNALQSALLASGNTGAPSATGTAASPTHTHVPPKLRVQELIGPIAAPGGAVHAQFAAGAAIDEAAGIAAAPLPYRTVQIARGGAGVATVYTITGTDPFGAAQVEVINSDGANTVQGTRAWGSITRIQSDVDPTVTTDVQWGNGFAVGAPFSDLDKLTCAATIGAAGTAEAAASSHGASGTIVPTTVPDGTKSFRVRYRTQPDATGAPSATVAIPTSTHTHTVTSASVHKDQSEVTVTLGACTNLATACALLNQMRAIYEGDPDMAGIYPGHRSDLLAHLAVDGTNTCAVGATPDATTQATGEALANALKAAFNAHRTQGGKHRNNDVANVVTAADANDLASLVTLANDLRTQLLAHLADGCAAPALRVLDP